MKTQLLISAKVIALSLVLLGVVYPLLIFVAGQALFPFRAGGSIVKEGSRVLGSELIAQDFSLPGYFQPRPSACDYDPSSSGGSNLGPTNPKLLEIYRDRIQRLSLTNGGASAGVPFELVAASASGLDPHISLGAALWQLPRIARARSLPRQRVEELVRKNADPPFLGFVGEWRVNVFDLNRQLDRLRPEEEAKKDE
ncbi:MAG: potassium-transporting ATPase subunit C [Candidatus Aminicenantes bacterium RBG_13_59_9]|nr:MAG: potassium-transporting ATPase subunit C [Candidatus Aminicenantes bacterium RBG_13_59_9]